MNSSLSMLASNLLWLVAAQQPLYSPPPALASVPPVGTGVSVTVYGVGRHFAFAHLFDSPEVARLARYSLVLTNESNTHIVGVAVRWIVTDRNGQNRTTTWSFDSFSTNQPVPQPVVPARTQLIATPGGFAIGRPDHVSSFGGHGQM